MHSARRAILATNGLVFGAGLAMGLAMAHAAPMPGATFARHAAQAPASVSPVAYRRCWTHNGKRHCERVARAYGARSGDRYSSSGYYEHIPERLPYGSSRWWDEMVRENRGGNGGGGGRN